VIFWPVVGIMAALQSLLNVQMYYNFFSIHCRERGAMIDVWQNQLGRSLIVMRILI
jgi:hypothetical protein